MSEFTFRRASIEDEAALISLYCAAYKKKMSLEWWRWWLNAPAGTNRTYVAVDPAHDAIVGAYSLAPFKLLLNGKVMVASLCNNVATHPDYQRRGIFSDLGRFALRGDGQLGIPLSVGMPNANALPGHLNVGWQIACSLPFMVKKNCQRVDHGCRPVVSPENSYQRLIARIARRFSFLPLRNCSEMEWRYCERPGVTYRMVVVDDYPEIAGYAVLKKFGKSTHVVDLHADTDAALHELINCATDYAADSEELTLYSNEHDPYRSVLEAHGFVPRQGHDRLILHGNIGPTEMPRADKGWSFALGASDVF